MKISSLVLNKFRNYDNLKLTLNDDLTVLFGENGQGKTNIVEAIYLCATGKSHRTSKESELLKFGGETFDVFLCLEKENYPREIEIKWNSEKKKQIRINEIPIKKMGELIGTLNAVMFAPEDMSIVKEGPANRRRFIDIAFSQIKPSYFYNLQQYSKILRNRNIILKEIHSTGKKNDTLEVWNQSLIEVGSKIVQERIKFVEQLSVLVCKWHSALSDEKERLIMNYRGTFKIDVKDDFETIKKNFMAKLEENYRSEVSAQTTVTGPHRDDFLLLLDGNELRHFGSQGQQRTAVLALKLAEVDVMINETGETPILLLDDVLSELDSKRQTMLLNSIKGIQTIITCTNKEAITANKEKSSFFEVKNGKISSFYGIIK